MSDGLAAKRTATAWMCTPGRCSWALFKDCLRPNRFSLHSGDLKSFLFWRLSIRYPSCIFQSCIFHPCYLLLHFPLLHFPLPRFQRPQQFIVYPLWHVIFCCLISPVEQLMSEAPVTDEVGLTPPFLCPRAKLLHHLCYTGVTPWKHVDESISVYSQSHSPLSLAIPPWVVVMTTSQRTVMPCGWGVKAGMVRESVAGKTVWSPCYHGPYLSVSSNAFSLSQYNLNTLPSDLHDITDTSTFRKRLKSVLFDRAYHWLLLALLDGSYSGVLQIPCWLIDWLLIGRYTSVRLLLLLLSYIAKTRPR